MERYSSYKDSGEKWLGEIPGHWEIRKAKYLWNESDLRSEYGSEQLLSVSQYDGVRESKEESRSESLKGYKMVAENDLVINIMLAWLGGLGVSSYNGLVSPAYCVYKMTDEQDPRFLHYLYRTPLYLAEFARRSSGIVPSRWRMYTDDFGQVLTILPPLPEQRAIVTYLDRVTGDIDRAIEESQKMIDLLNERKQIIIQHAVTKGLNKNAKLKYSGVEWIGEVPEGWECLPLRRVAEVNPSRKKKLSSDSLVGYAPMECIRNDNMQPLTSVLSRLSTGLTYCETNDIVLAKVTPCFENGNVAIVPQVENNCCFASSEIFVYRCGNRIESRFLLYYFQNKGFIDAGASTMQGTGGLKRVTTDFAKNAIITLPSMEEQKEIIKYLDDYTTHIKSAVASAERKIALLRERKQIIINEVVTGKVKVS